MKFKPFSVTFPVSASPALCERLAQEIERAGEKKKVVLERILWRGLGFDVSLYSDAELKNLVMSINGELILREQKNAASSQ